ncbi:MAG: hypothetical protein ACLRRB_01475 [Ruminococcus sp.]
MNPVEKMNELQRRVDAVNHRVMKKREQLMKYEETDGDICSCICGRQCCLSDRGKRSILCISSASAGSIMCCHSGHAVAECRNYEK